MWRDECLENHRRCRRSAGCNQPKLPSRLIDVTDPEHPLLRESATLAAQGANTQYVALSYCWGQGKKFLTLKSNYVSFTTAGISSHDLPRTFRDAVRATSNIGYQFIWIDALCIVQDDPADLQHELNIMGDIYRYAVLTICAQGAASSHSGLFESSRHPLSLVPCRVELSIATTPQSPAVAKCTLAGSVTSKDYLISRGWILQEDILTSRALRFGDQMSWRCMESFRTETEPSFSRSSVSCLSGSNFQRFGFTPSALDPFKTMRVWLYTDLAVPQDASIPGLEVVPPESDHFSSWYNMVQIYSDKELSFASDILRAVLGIAAIFRETYKTCYLAGLWKEDLFCGLGWYVSANDTRPVTARGLVSSTVATPKPEAHSAPSWTWASVGKVRVRFACISGGRDYDILPRRPRGKDREVLDAYCAWDDPINEAKPTVSGGTVPGQLWSLRIKTKVKRSVLRRSAVYTEWRMKNRTYGGRGIKNGEFESLKTAQGIYPRYPGRLLDSEDDSVGVGEAALDFGPEVDLTRLKAATTIRDRSHNELVKWTSGTDIENVGQDSKSQCLEVTCVLLDTYEYVADWYDVCLIVVPMAEGSISYTRIGLGLLLTGESQNSASRPGWEEMDCEIV